MKILGNIMMKLLMRMYLRMLYLSSIVLPISLVGANIWAKRLYLLEKLAPLKGKKRKRKSYTDSGWREYYGSNLELNEERTLIGNHNFKREILRFCKTKGEASYYEAKYIFGEDAIIKETYYNQWCSIKVSKSHIRL